MLLNSASPDAFLERADGLDMMAQRDGRALTAAHARRASRSAAGQGGDRRRGREQQKQVRSLTKKKKRRRAGARSVGGGAGRRLRQRQLAAGQAGAAQLRRLLAQGVLHGQRPDHRAAASPRALLHALPAGAGGRLQAVHVAATEPAAAGEHPKGRACDFSPRTRRLRERQRDRRRQGVRQQPGRVLRARTPTGSACCT